MSEKQPGTCSAVNVASYDGTEEIPSSFINSIVHVVSRNAPEMADIIASSSMVARRKGSTHTGECTIWGTYWPKMPKYMIAYNMKCPNVVFVRQIQALKTHKPRRDGMWHGDIRAYDHFVEGQIGIGQVGERLVVAASKIRFICFRSLTLCYLMHASTLTLNITLILAVR